MTTLTIPAAQLRDGDHLLPSATHVFTGTRAGDDELFEHGLPALHSFERSEVCPDWMFATARGRTVLLRADEPITVQRADTPPRRRVLAVLALVALAVALLLLAGCTTTSGGGGGGINGTPHHIGEAWGNRLDRAVDTAPWLFGASLLTVIAGALQRRRPRRGRYRAAG